MGVAFVLEMVLTQGMGLPLYSWLAWSPSLAMGLQGDAIDPASLQSGLLFTPGAGLELADLWQPFTHFLVQGPDLPGLLLLGLVAYFFLPQVVDRFTPRQLAQAAAAVALGCIAGGWLWVLIATGAANVGVPGAYAWLSRPGMGLGPFAFAVIALFALANPNAQVSLMFVVPMKARTLIWLDLGFIALAFLVAPGVRSFEAFGALGGVLAWWSLMGPGGSKRRYRKAGRDIERQLNFRVLEGGRKDPPKDPDEWVN